MSDKLSINHFFIQAEELSDKILADIQDLQNDVDLVILPEPNLSVLEEHGFSPDDLRNAGEDVPDDEDDALEFALREFKGSDEFYEWQNGQRPGDGMLYLWPLELEPAYGDPTSAPFDHQGLSNSMLEHGLNCCYISGEHQGRTYQGFILTGGGMNHSQDLCMAYVLAGSVPPHALLQTAVQNSRNDDWREIFLDCMERGLDYLQGQVGQYQNTLEIYRPGGPSLT